MLSTVQHIKQSVFKLRRCAILSISPQSVNIWELWRPAAGVLEMNVGPLLFDRGFLLLNSPVSSLSYYLYHDAPNLESSAAKPCHDSCSRHFCLALSSLNAHSRYIPFSTDGPFVNCKCHRDCCLRTSQMVSFHPCFQNLKKCKNIKITNDRMVF